MRYMEDIDIGAVMKLKADVFEETIEKRGTRALDAIIGARLREIRKREGLSQKEIADTLEISFQQFLRYEQGTNRVSAASLHQIANLFGFPMDTVVEPFRADPEIAGIRHKWLKTDFLPRAGLQFRNYFPARRPPLAA